VQDTKQTFFKQIDRYFNRSLDEVASNLEKIGSKRTDPNLNQHAFRGEVTLEEVVHIKPKVSKFVPGTLLTSPEGIDNYEENDFGVGNLTCASSEEMEANIVLGPTKEISEIGKTKRFLVPETIMITDEFIQIRKHTTVKAAENFEKSCHKNIVFYTVKHVLHVLDNKNKLTIPTNMFKEDNGQFSSDLVMFDTFDYDLVMHLYDTAKPEEIVKPLSIFNK